MKARKQVEKGGSGNIQSVARDQLIVQALQHALVVFESLFEFVPGGMHDFVAETLQALIKNDDEVPDFPFSEFDLHMRLPWQSG